MMDDEENKIKLAKIQEYLKTQDSALSTQDFFGEACDRLWLDEAIEKL